GVLRLRRLDCVLFDCAGLMPQDRQKTLLDQLAHSASIEALNGAAVVVFCVDATREDIAQDLLMRRQVFAERVIHAATKTDLLTDEQVSRRLDALKGAFEAPFLAVSAETGAGLDTLKE